MFSLHAEKRPTRNPHYRFRNWNTSKRSIIRFSISLRGLIMLPVVALEGTGLGLFIVKSYIDHWKGKIWLKSIEGKGTTFHIQLPIKSHLVLI